MSRVALAAVVLASGCQTFIGIEDVEGHLPRLDGDYLVGLKRRRVDGTIDVVRFTGAARLDPDTRELRLPSLDQLAEPAGTVAAENSIVGVVFDDGATEATFELS